MNEYRLFADERGWGPERVAEGSRIWRFSTPSDCEPSWNRTLLACELLVGLPDVNVLGVIDHPDGGPLEVHVECRGIERSCVGCGRAGWVKQRSQISLTDLPCFGRSTVLVWHKVRLECPNEACDLQSWTINDTDRRAADAVDGRAGRWVTMQVGRIGRTVKEVAVELGCGWHTVNDAVIGYGQ